MEHFPRTALAQQIANDLLGLSFLSDAPNGLFLAAPRRTGKSTFLQADLAPTLKGRGALVIYADLLENAGGRDPADLVITAIEGELHKHLGVVARILREGRVTEVAGAVKVDTSGIGQLGEMSLTQAIRALNKARRLPVALLIDEAQEALKSGVGEDLMWSLKSARDQLKHEGITFMLVMTGSDRDKLMRLMNHNQTPFWGSQAVSFPLLGDDYVDWVATKIEQAYPQKAPIDRVAMAEAFAVCGSRPQVFKRLMSEALNPLSSDPSQRFEHNLLAASRQQVLVDRAQMASDFQAMSPVEQVVLWRLLEQGAAFRPYDAAAKAFYAAKLGQEVTAQQAQAALESLRARSPSVVWKSLRGEYAIDDTSMFAWHQELSSQGQWPPGGGIKPLPEKAARKSARRSPKAG